MSSRLELLLEKEKVFVVEAGVGATNQRTHRVYKQRLFAL